MANTVGVRFLPGFRDIEPEPTEMLLRKVLDGELSINAARTRMGMDVLNVPPYRRDGRSDG